jgi:isoquinoline 1-oxidoreductase beta subunit
VIRIENVSRRDFLKGVAGAGAFALGVTVLPKRLFAENRMEGALGPSESMGKAALQPNVYLAIDTDGTAYVISHRSEMGNGVRAALPRIVADELDADWARVKVVQAIGDEKYGDQDTDGSHSVVSFFVPLREAGASARLMLVRAAAQKWNVPAEECSTELHTVVHKKSGQKLGYGELAEAAAKLEVPKKEELKLKPRSEWRYIGKDAPVYDLQDVVTGKGIYGQDARMDGMLYASVLHPPVLGTTPKSIDNKDTLAVKGVKQTETIDTFKPPVLFQALGGVAVIADNTWAAMQGK